MDATGPLLAVHIAAGSAGLVLGALALLTESPPAYRSWAGAAYVWAVLITAATAIALVALHEWELWWILPLGVFAGALAVAGYLAPARRHASWIRVYAHGQGGAYIALVTALFVVSLSGAVATAAWIVPTLAGVALIERRVSRLKANPGAASSPSATPPHSNSRALRTESHQDT